MQHYLQMVVRAAPASAARAGRFMVACGIGVLAGLFFMATARLVLFAVGTVLDYVS